MNMQEHGKPRVKKLGAVGRKPVALEAEAVRVEALRPETPMPVVIRPAAPDVDLVVWARANRATIESHLITSGAILFRDFGVSGAARFDEFIRAVSDEPAEYQEPATPRTHVGGGVYTSTDFPPDRRILLHNENSHCPNWPLRLFFFCAVPAEQGGETPVADSRRIARLLDPRLKEQFLDKQILYVRNFGDGLALPWQAVFNTRERSEVESYCRRYSIEAEWKSGDRLRVRYVRPAVAHHPRTGDEVWFNHVPLFHVSRLAPDVREALLAEFGEEGLPYNAYYGDGTRIEAAELDEICDLYMRERVLFDWRPGDILMIDNMLTAHGREPYVGPQRKILVGMAEPCGIAEDSVG
jgi:alpha-ketoglutarate-dependent taurine dioxygenase